MGEASQKLKKSSFYFSPGIVWLPGRFSRQVGSGQELVLHFPARKKPWKNQGKRGAGSSPGESNRAGPIPDVRRIKK